MEINPNIAKKLVRPDSNAGLLQEGSYPAEISSVSFASRPDQFKPGSDRDVMVVTFSVNYDGKIVRLNYEVTVTWSEKGKMFALLDTLKCLPEEGSNFNPDTLLGAKATVFVKNVTNNGKEYSNIASVYPPTRSTANVTSASKKISREEIDAEIDAILSDLDDD